MAMESYPTISELTQKQRTVAIACIGIMSSTEVAGTITHDLIAVAASL